MNRRYLLKSLISSSTISISLYNLGEYLNNKTNLQYTIEQSIEQSNISETYEPWFGDCWHIAVAIHNLYDKTTICGVIHPQNPEYPLHVFIEANNKYFDGKGTMTVSTLQEEWAQLNPDINYYSKEYITSVPYYEESEMNKIQQRISETKAYKNWTDMQNSSSNQLNQQFIANLL